MAHPDRIEGLAIVSADGMIADAAGVQPQSLKLDADQRFFHMSTARADVLVHGRHSGDAGPDAAARPRIVLTRTVEAIARDPSRPNRVLWNPAGAPLGRAWDALGARGVLVVIGGTDVFGMFLELGYDAFHLSRTGKAHLPGGRPVFPNIPPQTPDALLSASSLTPGPIRLLDADDDLTLVTWSR
jgi:dihydrofolate reductase